ncbi:MAG: CDP-glycerol glycerophosphotransferase family protein [Clostridia bacterium]|nr:CDP-glycerol glycerophosphotransferase family protein [Clostridia bacterium]
MKRFFYSLYAVMFSIFRILPLKRNKITFLSPHNENFNDSLGAVMDEVIMRDEFIIVKMSSKLGIDKSSVKALISSVAEAIRFFTVDAYHLATSKYIFLNDNFMPMAKLNFRAEVVITQLWHAEGVFKKFGLHIEQPQEIRALERACSSKLSYVVCSSEEVADIYAEAFDVSRDKVLPLGAPRTDKFYKKINEKRLRDDFDRQYPECKGKKLVLYAPTFRENTSDDATILNSFDINAFNERFPDSKLLIRLHPQVHTADAEIDGAVNLSEYDDVQRLMRIADVLITDYSSICMDFALLDKPVYFYAFDLEKYNADRSFYFDYESYVPGPVARDFQTLLNLMYTDMSQTYEKRRYSFVAKNFGTPDGKASERVVDRIIYNKEI